MVRKTWVRATIAVLGLFIAWVPNLEAQAPSSAATGTSKPSSMEMGLLFNVPSLIGEPESYEGGIGLKFGAGQLLYRASFDFTYNDAAASFKTNETFALEYHVISGPVSPYIGGSLGAGWTWQQDVASMIPLSLGAIAGVEVFLFDFVSVYVEYTLVGTLTLSQDLQTQAWTKSFLLNTGLGNNARLGFVIYFIRAGQPAKK